MTTDREALLDAIQAEPNDDGVRLVYADWLEDNGDTDHAELIRLQCQLAGLPKGSVEYKQVAGSVRRLERSIARRLDIPQGVKVHWQRGFVDRITTGMLNFISLDERLIPYAPALELVLDRDNRDETEMEKLDFDEYDAVFQRFAACSHLSTCTALDLSRYCPGTDGMQFILQSPHLINLRRLNAPNNEAGPYVEVVASPTFSRLEWANFRNSDSASDCPSITPIVTCPHLSRLQHLDFGENEQFDDNLYALASSSHMRRLQYLSLSVSGFTQEAIHDFAHSRTLPSLQQLDLSFLGFHLPEFHIGHGDAYLVALVDSPLIEQLTHLWFIGNQISDVGARALANSPRNLQLQFIDLGNIDGMDRNNRISSSGRAALQKRLGKGVCSFRERADFT